MKTEYIEIRIDEVMRFFAEGFEWNDKNKSVKEHSYFYDSKKGIVVFKLWVDTKEK